MSILIKNGTLVTMNTERQIIKGDLLIENDRIAEINPVIDKAAGTIINATDKLVIPGLIQAHVHLCQTLFRGLADDLELLDWLKYRIWPLEGAHDEESLYFSSLLGCMELLRGGTTAIIDMATVSHTNSVFEAVNRVGIRYLGGKCLMDKGEHLEGLLLDSTNSAIEESLDLYSKWNGKANGRIHYALCPRFALSCTTELLAMVQAASNQYSIPIHTHASENLHEVRQVREAYGTGNVSYLNALGLCNSNLILAHCIHISDEEKKILATTKTNVVHCPGSNLKLASGIADVPGLLKTGTRVSLGSDGPPCNNNLSMFNEMRLASLIHKPFNGPKAMPAEKVFEMATVSGAYAMGLNDEIGSLEVGKKADVVVIDLDNWHTWPMDAASAYSHLVYQAQASDVYATIVDGTLLMLNGCFLKINPDEIKSGVDKSLARIRKQTGI
ncbi:MAG: 5'-deoxyadenosine deaminase [Syntrophomonadaceae bacterium]|nr:5'-deoxyadenosine deaminase [Syntrophomonadaceae bacterium]